LIHLTRDYGFDNRRRRRADCRITDIEKKQDINGAFINAAVTP